MILNDKNVYLISLGCSKNLVDSENILGILKERGFSIASDIEEASVVIINTCGFIQSAVEECIETIFEIASFKEKGAIEKLFVTGCFVQRYGYKLQKEIPEVDGWLGTGEISRIGELVEEKSDKSTEFIIGKPEFLADHTIPRIQTTPFYSSYLKIAEGCSHKCSFCTIPGLRGNFRSRDPESVIFEAEEMAKKGIKEINLIAQDSTMYGKDIADDVRLEDLLEKLLSINDVEWIRFLYAHPFGISDRLLDLVAGENRICSYLDLPFQHSNENILKLMNRDPGDEKPLELINRIRSLSQSISMRTTLIIGFPGETDEIFDELYNFVKAAEFDHLGAFVFSPEEGTPAARMGGIPNRKTALQRLESIMQLQNEISKRKNQRFIDQTLPVLIEGISPETDLLLKGRTSFMAPDVDGQVLINKGEGRVGDIMPVRINEAYAYDIVGEIV